MEHHCSSHYAISFTWNLQVPTPAIADVMPMALQACGGREVGPDLDGEPLGLPCDPRAPRRMAVNLGLAGRWRVHRKRTANRPIVDEHEAFAAATGDHDVTSGNR